jgi:hypothetical protein
MNAPFRVIPLRLDSAPDPAAVADLFKALDELEATARKVRSVLDGYRQQHMARTRCYGIDLAAYRRAVEGERA